MARDEFIDYPGEQTTVYRYMWNDDTNLGYQYTIRFFDNFAVIDSSSPNSDIFFGTGTTIVGIYAKLPSVG